MPQTVLSGWRFLRDLWAEIGRDRVGLLAAGIAFYGLLSLFPGIAAMMALGGLLTKPAVLVEQMQQIGAMLPPEASAIIVDQATRIAGSQSGGLGLTALVGLVLSIYSASRAVGSLIMGIHAAANERDDRGIVAGIAFTLGMTLLALALVLLAIFSTLVLPAVLAVLQTGSGEGGAVALIRWPLMWFITAVGLGLFYRWSFRHRDPPSPWITPGALVASFLWIAGSVLLSVYVQNFADYNETFGTLGGVISLLMWMWLSAYIVLLGEEINALVAERRAGDNPEPATGLQPEAS